MKTLFIGWVFGMFFLIFMGITYKIFELIFWIWDEIRKNK